LVEEIAALSYVSLRMPGRKLPSTKKSPLAVAIGKILYAQRTERGLTQEKFAELVDLSKNYIGNIERGEYEVSISALHRISQSLGTSPSALLKRAGY
jgi:DNA-binding XRE family transcriptional regulator